MLDKEDLMQIADLMNLVVENVVTPRFDLLAEGQTAIISRLDRMEERQDRMEERMDRMEIRMDRMEVRMDHMEEQLTELKDVFTTHREESDRRVTTLEVQLHGCLEDMALLKQAQ